MKAQDLMIGDWVMYNNKTYRIAEIGGMVCLTCRRKDIFVSLDEIEPIPPTPEILEKNGFAKRQHYEIYALFTDDYELRYYPKQNRVSVSIILEDGIDTREYSTPSNYIHELQHALRLCRIDKEITL